MKRIKTTCDTLCTVIFCLIILAGCATKNTIKEVSEEDILRARVTEFWEFRVNLELDKCYSYEYPLLRKKIKLVNYIRSFDAGFAKWKGFSIREISIDGEKAVVKLGVRSLITMPGTTPFEQDSDVTEQWIKTDGTWYHVPKRFL